jgi:hypothetical protein
VAKLTPPQFQVADPAFVLTKEPNAMPLEIEVQFSQLLDKADTSTVITIRSENTGGYPIEVLTQNNVWPPNDNEWESLGDVGAVSLKIPGNWEQDELIAFFQKLGLMTIPVYGKVESPPPYEPEDTKEP